MLKSVSKIVNNTIPKLVTKYTKLVSLMLNCVPRYGALTGQRMNAISAISRYIGGVYVDRSFPEQNAGVKPFTPVPLATQKRAMDVLAKNVFAPNAFDADAQVISLPAAATPWFQSEPRW